MIGTEVIRWSEQRPKPAATTESPSCDCSCLKPAQLFHARLLLIHEPGSKAEGEKGKTPNLRAPTEGLSPAPQPGPALGRCREDVTPQVQGTWWSRQYLQVANPKPRGGRWAEGEGQKSTDRV